MPGCSLTRYRKDTLLTFFPKRESSTTEGPLYQQADLRDSIFNDVNSDLSRQCDTSLDMAALIALHAVTVLLDRSSHPDLEIFRIFEESISILTEKMTSSLKDFRTQSLHPKSFYVGGKGQDVPERSIREMHAAQARATERENRDSTSALLELRDLEDELTTLSNLFSTQLSLLETMASHYRRLPDPSLSPSGLSFLSEALSRVSDFKHRSDEMNRRVRSTRDDYDKLLQMVQRQAQVDEVRLQRLQADLASAQGRSVIIFTTFTVIFLPLSFFTSLFGMNTAEWSPDTPQGKIPSLKLISLISLPTSVCLILLALVLAWSTRVRRFFTFLTTSTLSLTSSTISTTTTWGSEFVTVLVKRKEEERRIRDERQRRLKKEMSEESGDFWERHRLERDDKYEIPAGNRRSGVRERVGRRKEKK